MKNNQLSLKSLKELDLDDIEILSSKDYFEYLCFYFNDLKENNFQEFNYLYGKEREPDELAYCQLSKSEKKQILN